MESGLRRAVRERPGGETLGNGSRSLHRRGEPFTKSSMPLAIKRLAVKLGEPSVLDPTGSGSYALTFRQVIH